MRVRFTEKVLKIGRPTTLVSSVIPALLLRFKLLVYLPLTYAKSVRIRFCGYYLGLFLLISGIL